jgi:hypothetical protein
VVCAGVGLGAGAGGVVGGASVGVGVGVVDVGAGAWLPELAAGVVVAPAAGEVEDDEEAEAAPLGGAPDEPAEPGVLDEDCGCEFDEVAANVWAAVLANITTRPTAATRLSSATCQVRRDARSKPSSRRRRGLRCFMGTTTAVAGLRVGQDRASGLLSRATKPQRGLLTPRVTWIVRCCGWSRTSRRG